jgi:flagellar motor switch protein FliG
VDGMGIAQEILNILKPMEQEKLLKALREKDAVLAKRLDEGRLTIEDLALLKPEMLAKLMQKVDAKDLGLSLRLGSENLRDFVLNNVSKGTKSDILEILNGPPQAVSEIEKSVEKILKVLKNMIEKGDIFLDKGGDDPLI